MRIYKIFFTCLFSLLSAQLLSQPVDLAKASLMPVHVSMSRVKLGVKTAIRVTKDSAVKGFDEPTFVKLPDIDLSNGTIEVSVLSRLLPAAPETARGFIGLAFRVSKTNDQFECIYIRPTNGRAEDQLRRNHAIQYCSYPGYTFDRFRKEAPGVYESYADMGLNEWIKLKIVVKDQQARLFINDNKQPSLIVNDLKLGAAASGAIGFFVDTGTEGFFADARIKKDR